MTPGDDPAKIFGNFPVAPTIDLTTSQDAPKRDSNEAKLAEASDAAATAPSAKIAKTEDPLGGGAPSVKSAATASSARSAGVRQLLGLGARSHRSTAASGPSNRHAAQAAPPAEEPEQDGSDVDLDDVSTYSRGDFLKCPCGNWRPPPGLKTNAMYAQAVAHWRDCQGCRPPKMSAEERKRVHKEACERNSQGQATEAARVKFGVWKKSLQASLRAYVCEPVLDVPFVSGGSQGLMYVCGRCSAKRTLAGMRRDPCKECPKGLTNAEWQRSALGKAQVDTLAAKRAITRGHKKQKAWRKTEEGRIYFQDKIFGTRCEFPVPIGPRGSRSFLPRGPRTDGRQTNPPLMRGGDIYKNVSARGRPQQACPSGRGEGRPD